MSFGSTEAAKQAAVELLAKTDDLDEIKAISTVFTDVIAQSEFSDKAALDSFLQSKASEIRSLQAAGRAAVIGDVTARNSTKPSKK